MLLDAQLPAPFWAEALATAVHVRNRTMTKHGGEKTPIERWSGRKPTVAYMKTFGCLSYYMIPSKYRTKLEARAEKGIFLGYSKCRKAYRIYDVTTGDVCEVRSVRFDETKRGSELLLGEFESDSVMQLNRPDESGQHLHEDEEIFVSHEPNQNIVGMQHTTTGESSDESTERRPTVSQPLKPGRKHGDTAEVLRLRHAQQMIEREERLRQEGVRRSPRLNPELAEVTMAARPQNDAPSNYAEALNSIESEKWKEAMDKEIQVLYDREVWTLEKRPKDRPVLKSKWVYVTKPLDDQGKVKHKARLVAVGTSQRAGLDFDESYAPVMGQDTLRLLLTIAARLKLKVRQYDVRSAYLYGELRGENIYMEQPEGYSEDNSLVCKLLKGIYGLRQSGRYWYSTLHEHLSTVGLRRLETEPCVYIYQRGPDIVILGVYVDDVLLMGSSDDILNEIVGEISSKFQLEEITTSERLFLGIRIREHGRGFALDQMHYIDKVLERYGMSGCNPCLTPGDPNQNTDQYQESEPIDKTHYQEVLGSLMYLSTSSRPDIAFHVSKLAQYCQDPRRIHMNSIKKIYRYLKGTRDYCLIIEPEGNEISVCSDASWGNSADARSFSGHAIKVMGCLVSWRSRKQPLVAMSTCEAELVAICEGVKDSKWIIMFLEELGLEFGLSRVADVMTDSRAAEAWIHRGAISARTRHINRRYYFVRDEVDQGNFTVHHIPSEEMVADIFTKPLSQERHRACAEGLSLQRKGGPSLVSVHAGGECDAARTLRRDTRRRYESEPKNKGRRRNDASVGVESVGSSLSQKLRYEKDASREAPAISNREIVYVD